MKGIILAVLVLVLITSANAAKDPIADLLESARALNEPAGHVVTFTGINDSLIEGNHSEGSYQDFSGYMNVSCDWNSS